MVKYSNMKRLKYLFSFLIIIAIPIFPFFVSAVGPNLEVNYPTLPGIALSNGSTLGQYIQYIFTFAFTVAGIIGVITIIIAGFQILLFAGNPSKISEARERIFNAALGIALLMATVIIITTINPNILSPGSPTILLSPGVYLVAPNIVSSCPVGNLNASGGCKDATHPEGFIYRAFTDKGIPDTTIAELSQYIGFFYFCPTGSLNNKSILFWGYDAPNYHINPSPAPGASIPSTGTIPCGNTDPNTAINIRTVGIMSLAWGYFEAGVYYYMSTDCSGIASYHNIHSPAQTISGDIQWFELPDLNPALDQTVRSIAIANNPSQSFNYGVVLTEGSNLKNECSDPIIGTNTYQCITLMDEIGNPDQIETLDGDNFIAYSAHIIKQDKTPSANPRNQGVTFWSKNKEFSLSQSNNSDPHKNIGQMWKYNQSVFGHTTNLVQVSPPTIDYPAGDNGLDPSDPNYIAYTPASLPNDGNLDNAIRFLGSPANNNINSVPDLECLGYRYDAPLVNRDPTYRDPPEGRGYLSCLEKITKNGSYSVILYTKNNNASQRACQVYSEDIIIYNDRVTPPYFRPQTIFSQYQTIYQTIVIPTTY